MSFIIHQNVQKGSKYTEKAKVNSFIECLEYQKKIKADPTFKVTHASGCHYVVCFFR